MGYGCPGRPFTRQLVFVPCLPMSASLVRRSVLVVEPRAAIVSGITHAVEGIQAAELVGCVPDASDPLVLSLDAHPRVVVCGTGVLLPHTLAQLPTLRSLWPQAYLIALSF